MFRGVTNSGYVRVIAILFGTPTVSIGSIGSPVEEDQQAAEQGEEGRVLRNLFFAIRNRGSQPRADKRGLRLDREARAYS